MYACEILGADHPGTQRDEEHHSLTETRTTKSLVDPEPEEPITDKDDGGQNRSTNDRD